MTAPNAGYTPDPAPREPDLQAFAKAVRFRDRAVTLAVAQHERAALQPSSHHARATFDAIEQLIREDERARLAATGRLVPAGSRKLSDEWAVRVTREAGDTTIRHEGDPYVNRRRAEQIADSARSHPTVAAAEPVTREVWVGPWLPAPTNTEESA